MPSQAPQNIKIGVFGDPHLTHQLPYTTLGSPYRKDQLVSFLTHSFEVMMKNKVDLILVLGDLCHRAALDADDLDLLICFLEFSRVSEIPTVIIEGNHDLDGNKSILKFLARYSENADNIFFDHEHVDCQWSFDGLNTEIISINYCSDEEFLSITSSYASTLTSKRDHLRILMGHIGIKGSMHGTMKSIRGIKSEDIERIGKDYDLMIFGHHHNFQLVGEKAFYAGALHQVRIDERDTVPGSLILKPKENMWKVRQIENTFSPRFYMVEDYILDPKRVRGNIVKPIIDTQNHSEKMNIDFVKKIESLDPYYLIMPKFKRTFVSKTVKTQKMVKEDKLKTLKKVVRKMNGKKYEEHIIKLYREVRENG